MHKLFPTPHTDIKTMLFVDGENLSIRYGDELKTKNIQPISRVKYLPNVYIWSLRFHQMLIQQCKPIRTHYYTAVQGDDVKIDTVVDDLRSLKIEHPSVFQKKKGVGSKQVDISLATDMLVHASHRNYETAILVAGDEDYIPLVKAVKNEGCRVVLWFLDNGLSPKLKQVVDFYFDLSPLLFTEKIYGVDE